MFLHLIFRAMAVAVLIVSVAAAQSVTDTGTANSTKDQSLPVVQYKSAFSDYVPYTELKIESWRQANDTVAEIGGWRTYAKEAHQSDSSTGHSNTRDSSAGRHEAKEDVK